ncbi:hypothetical protein [Porphyromonas loveana]|uniref:hypothetical protein n=1 Tax=Porphyromonas loveana TaxID=1884669 RepID=UPI0035A1A130
MNSGEKAGGSARITFSCESSKNSRHFKIILAPFLKKFGAKSKMFWRELYRIARTIFSRFSARHFVHDAHTPSKDNPTRHRSEVRRDFLYVQLVDNKTGLLLVINCTQHSSPLLIFRANCVTKCIEMALHSMAICVQKAKKTRQKLGKLVFLSHLWAKIFSKTDSGALSATTFSAWSRLSGTLKTGTEICRKNRSFCFAVHCASFQPQWQTLR